MRVSAAVRWSFLLVGVVLVLLNTMQVTVGFARLRRALAADPIPKRLDEPLRTAWVYTGIVGIALGALLLALSGDAAAGNPAAWKAGVGIGLTLVATGIASFLATRSHPGLLIVSVFGIAILVPLWLSR